MTSPVVPSSSGSLNFNIKQTEGKPGIFYGAHKVAVVKSEDKEIYNSKTGNLKVGDLARITSQLRSLETDAKVTDSGIKGKKFEVVFEAQVRVPSPTASPPRTPPSTPPRTPPSPPSSGSSASGEDEVKMVAQRRAPPPPHGKPALPPRALNEAAIEKMTTEGVPIFTKKEDYEKFAQQLGTWLKQEIPGVLKLYKSGAGFEANVKQANEARRTRLDRVLLVVNNAATNKDIPFFGAEWQKALKDDAKLRAALNMYSVGGEEFEITEQ